MAYQTGTINASTDFTAILDSFLLANGWTKVNNNVNISITSLTYSNTSTCSLTFPSAALNAVPVGAKLTWTGSGAVNVYLSSKSSLTGGLCITDSTFTNPGAVSVNFAWTTYTKGTKRINFACGIHNTPTGLISTAQYILFDLYHLASGNHNTTVNKLPCVRFDPAQSELPATYHIFSNNTPDTVSGVFVFGAATQHFHLGDLGKVHTSAYVGGEFFCASSSILIGTAIKNCGYTETSMLLGNSSHGGGAIFTNTNSGVAGGLLHCEIDSTLYSASANPTGAGIAGINEPTCRKFYRSLNDWNGQALLVTPEIYFGATGNTFKMYLGYIEHLRFLRIDNYNIGDTITLGADQWKVFPFSQKNASLRDGGIGGLSGTGGFACRYTP